jgi:hypothetical protein
MFGATKVIASVVELVLLVAKLMFPTPPDPDGSSPQKIDSLPRSPCAETTGAVTVCPVGAVGVSGWPLLAGRAGRAGLVPLERLLAGEALAAGAEA